MVGRLKTEILVTQSLIDRLADTGEWPTTRTESIRVFRDSLKRDVEWLLNTRQPVISEIDGYPTVAGSVLNFGLPDIHDYNNSGSKGQNALTLALERCLRIFETRIHNPRVFLAKGDSANRSLRFQIEGEISYENMREEIKFDTVLEMISGEYEVK